MSSAAAAAAAGCKDTETQLAVENDKKQSVTMTNAKEEFNLKRSVSYLDRAQRTIVAGFEIDQKLILSRFEAMVRRTRIRQAINGRDRDTVKRLRVHSCVALNASLVASGEKKLTDVFDKELCIDLRNVTIHSSIQGSSLNSQRLQTGKGSLTSRDSSPGSVEADDERPEVETSSPSDPEAVCRRRRHGGRCSTPRDNASRQAAVAILRPVWRFSAAPPLLRVKTAPAAVPCRHLPAKTHQNQPPAASLQQQSDAETGNGNASPTAVEDKKSNKNERKLKRLSSVMMTSRRAPAEVQPATPSGPTVAPVATDKLLPFGLSRRPRQSSSAGVKGRGLQRRSTKEDLFVGDPRHFKLDPQLVSGDYLSRRLKREPRPVGLEPIEDDRDWTRLTTVQHRARSLTLRGVCWDGTSPCVNQLDKEADNQRKQQLRRAYRRLAKAAEERNRINQMLASLGLTTDARTLANNQDNGDDTD